MLYIHLKMSKIFVYGWGLEKNTLHIYALMIIGTLALTGFPFLSGYYSKDAIIEFAYLKVAHDWIFCCICRNWYHSIYDINIFMETNF